MEQVEKQEQESKGRLWSLREAKRRLRRKRARKLLRDCGAALKVQSLPPFMRSIKPWGGIHGRALFTILSCIKHLRL